jgi:flavodoxin
MSGKIDLDIFNKIAQPDLDGYIENLEEKIPELRGQIQSAHGDPIDSVPKFNWDIDSSGKIYFWFGLADGMFPGSCIVERIPPGGLLSIVGNHFTSSI